MKIAFFGHKIDSKNEALAKQFQLLAEALNADIVSFNDDYVLFDGKRIKLPKNILLKRLLVLYYWKKYEKKYDTIIFHSHIDTILLKLIKKKKYINFLTKGFEDDPHLNRYVKNIAPKFKGIVVQKKDFYTHLKKLGLKNVFLTYPFLKKIKIDSKKQKNFTILFASAPYGKNKYNKYYVKGVKVLLDGFEKFGKGKLILLWRDSCTNYLEKDLTKNKMKKHITVINKHVDINKMFEKVDCVILPYKEQLHSPDYPLSAIEALMFKKPVISSDIIEMGQLIEDESVGIKFSPDSDSLAKALQKVYDNYDKLTENNYKVFKKYFSYNENVKKIKKIIK